MGVLTTTISAVGKLGSASRPHRAVEDVDIHLRLGGLTSRGPGIQDDHLVWFEDYDLKPGDKVSLEVIEAAASDPVQSGKPAQQRADDEREYYAHCKKVYFELKEKYDGNV